MFNFLLSIVYCWIKPLVSGLSRLVSSFNFFDVFVLVFLPFLSLVPSLFRCGRPFGTCLKLVFHCNNKYATQLENRGNYQIGIRGVKILSLLPPWECRRFKSDQYFNDKLWVSKTWLLSFDPNRLIFVWDLGMFYSWQQPHYCSLLRTMLFPRSWPVGNFMCKNITTENSFPLKETQVP